MLRALKEQFADKISRDPKQRQNYDEILHVFLTPIPFCVALNFLFA